MKCYLTAGRKTLAVFLARDHVSRQAVQNQLLPVRKRHSFVQHLRSYESPLATNNIPMQFHKTFDVFLARQSSLVRFYPLLEEATDNSCLALLPLGVRPVTQQPDHINDSHNSTSVNSHLIYRTVSCHISSLT